jgi:hypothetical protein
MAVIYRELSLTDAASACSLFNLVFNQSVGADWFLWKHFQHPGTTPAPKIVAVDGDQIVGMFLSLPATFRYENTQVQAVQVVDNCVHPDYRGFGQTLEGMAAVFEQAASSSVDFAWGWPTPPNLQYGVQQLGYRVLGLKQLLAKRFPALPISNASGIALAGPVGELDLSDDLFANTGCEGGRLAQEKNHQWWNWRYLDQTAGNYSVFHVLKDNAKCGLLAIRKFQVDGHNAACIYDLLLASDVDHSEAIAGVVSQLQNKISELCSLYAYEGCGPLARPLLEQLGFAEVLGGVAVGAYKRYPNATLTGPTLENDNVWNLTPGDTDW